MMKQLDATETPSANPIVKPAASMTRAVVCTTPATQPSASPCATIIPANMSGRRNRRSATLFGTPALVAL